LAATRNWFLNAFREGKIGRWTLDDLEGDILGERADDALGDHDHDHEWDGEGGIGSLYSGEAQDGALDEMIGGERDDDRIIGDKGSAQRSPRSSARPIDGDGGESIHEEPRLSRPPQSAGVQPRTQTRTLSILEILAQASLQGSNVLPPDWEQQRESQPIYKIVLLCPRNHNGRPMWRAHPHQRQAMVRGRLKVAQSHHPRVPSSLPLTKASRPYRTPLAMTTTSKDLPRRTRQWIQRRKRTQMQPHNRKHTSHLSNSESPRPSNSSSRHKTRVSALRNKARQQISHRLKFGNVRMSKKLEKGKRNGKRKE
jgi:hypothetical protein